MTWSSSSRRSRASAGARWAVLLLLLLFTAAGGRAHVPVPDSVLAPHTPAEAWNVLRLATANVERLLREGRLAEVPDQISLCSPALRVLPKWAADPSAQTRAAEQVVRASVAVSSLAQASVAGDRTSATDMFGSLRDALAKLAAGYDAKTVGADIFYCPMHPDFLSADPAARCDKCGMALLTRRIPYSFVYVPSGEPTLRLTATVDADPTQGREAHVLVRLARRDGSPVSPPDLLVMHTQPIHLLVVDASLEDYHHEHPVPTKTPGEYAFSFTPSRPTDYHRIFADIVPADTGVQEYPSTDLPSKDTPLPPPDFRNRPSTFTAAAGGMTFRLSFEETDGSPPRAGQARTLHVMVSDPAGHPVTALEPVMNAYAHLVGFYGDGRTVVHLHPAGGEILDPGARGGPTLDFKLYPPRAGFLRLYCQVQVGGRQIFAPFDVNVSP